MVKRLLSILITLVLAVSIGIAPAVSAAENYDDYAPGDKPANMLGGSSNDVSGATGGSSYTDNGSYVTVDYTNGRTFIVKEGGAAGAAASHYYNIVGLYIDKSRTNGLNGQTFTSGEDYVVEMQLKNMNSSVVSAPEFAVGFYSSDADEKSCFPMARSTVTSADTYQDFKTTLHVDNGGNLATIFLGYPKDNMADGAQVSFKRDAFYIAKETACDISVTTDSSNAVAGGTTTVKAQLLNQSGLTGNLPQSFTWKALNADKTAEVAEIAVAAGENGTATVSVGSGVTAGDYYILAIADEKDANNATIQKSVKISVIDTTDLEPTVTKANNMITASVSSLTSASQTSSGMTYVGETEGCGLSVDSGKSSSLTRTVNGSYRVKGHNADYNNYIIESGKNYVVEMQLKNIGTSAAPTFGVMLASDATGNNGVAKTVAVTETTGWQDFKYTLKATDAHSYIILGFGADPGEGSKVIVKNNSFYIAEEQAYNLNVTCDSPNVLAGGTIAVKAQMLNQSGMTGNLSQGFTWMALTADRTAIAEGITVTPAADGTATVSVADSVTAGDYVILAISDSYSGFRQGVTITVGGEETVSSLTLSEQNGVATLSATVENTDEGEILFAVASYITVNGEKQLSNVNVSYVQPVSGVATVSDLTLSVNAGETVKAYVWSKDLRVIKHKDTFTTSLMQ